MTTLNLQVGAGADDAFQQQSSMFVSQVYVMFGAATFATGLRFIGVSGLALATINSATLSCKASAFGSSSFVGNFYGQDVEAPGTFTTAANNITSRSRTTYACRANSSDLGSWTFDSWYNFTGAGGTTLAGIIQELANDYDPSAIVLIHIGVSGSGNRQFRSYDGEAAGASKLAIDYTAGAGTQTAYPTPLAMSAAIPAPTLVPGAATLAPTPIVMPMTVIQPALTSTYTVTPNPVAAAWAVPAPTLSCVARITPSPVAMTFVIPAPTAESTGVVQTIHPSPVAAAWAVPAPALARGATTISPSPLAATWAIPAPVLTSVATLTPDPVTMTMAVPTPTLLPGAVTIAPSPVVATWAIPAPTLGGMGVTYRVWGFDRGGVFYPQTRQINAADFAAGARFYLEGWVVTSDPAVPAYIRLYNLTDGVPVAGSEASTTETIPARLRSDTFSLVAADKEYRIEYGGQPGGLFTCWGGDVLVEVD